MNLAFSHGLSPVVLVPFAGESRIIWLKCSFQYIFHFVAMHSCPNQNILQRLLDQVRVQRAEVLVPQIVTLLRVKRGRAGFSKIFLISRGSTDSQIQTRIIPATIAEPEVVIMIRGHPVFLVPLQLEGALTCHEKATILNICREVGQRDLSRWCSVHNKTLVFILRPSSGPL